MREKTAKKDMKDGILIIKKAQEWTSHDCVAVCRKAIGGIKKTGHGGTLDPMAEGLLPIFIGKATRISEYLDADMKTYECRAKLGLMTDTMDIWGKVIDTRDTGDVTEEKIRSALEAYHGEVEQIPPKYSAIKMNGKRLYEYARAGQDVEIKPRKVYIDNLEITDIDTANMEVSFVVICSKGTYVRSICSDLGESLGCGGTLSYLKRTGSGIFDLTSAVSPDKLKTMNPEEIDELIVPMDVPLTRLGKATINSDRLRYFRNGASIRWIQVKPVREPFCSGNIKNNRGIPYNILYRVYREETGEFVGIGYHDKKNNLLKADKIFYDGKIE